MMQTFFTEQAAPVPLTVALPGGLAGPVDAAGVELTVVTEHALPAEVTPVRQ